MRYKEDCAFTSQEMNTKRALDRISAGVKIFNPLLPPSPRDFFPLYFSTSGPALRLRSPAPLGLLGGLALSLVISIIISTSCVVHKMNAPPAQPSQGTVTQDQGFLSAPTTMPWKIL